MACAGSDIGGVSMNKKSLYRIIGFLAALLAFSITYIAFYDMPGMVDEIKDLKVELTANKEMLKDQNLDLAALSIKNKHLRLDIADMEIEMITLKAEGMAYGDMISILEYCVSYINYLQMRMGQHGIAYPEFIVRSVVRDLIMEGIEG